MLLPRPWLSAPRKRRFPSDMKGDHPEKNRANRKRGSLRDAVRYPAEAEPESRGRNTRLRNSGPNASEPRGSPVRTVVTAEPLQPGRRQHAARRCSINASLRLTGVTGTARCEGKALNVGGLDQRGRQPQPQAQGRKPRLAGWREVGWVRSTREGGESHWREGALLDEAFPAGKEWRLWRH